MQQSNLDAIFTSELPFTLPVYRDQIWRYNQSKLAEIILRSTGTRFRTTIRSRTEVSISAVRPQPNTAHTKASHHLTTGPKSNDLMENKARLHPEIIPPSCSKYKSNCTRGTTTTSSYLEVCLDCPHRNKYGNDANGHCAPHNPHHSMQVCSHISWTDIGASYASAIGPVGA